MFAMFAVALTMTLVGATALARPAPASGVVAVDDRGRTLPRNPLLRPGERITLIASGFAAGTPVEVRALDGESTVTADATGAARFAFTVPVPIAGGAHVLRFVGAPRPGAPPAAGPVAVTVPLLAEFPFRTPGRSASPSSGVGGVVVGPGGSPVASPAGAPGRPADTGVDVVGLVGLGGLAVGLGAGVVHAARRRGPTAD